MRKATAFRGGANKTAPPCFPETISNNLATVPVEQLQRNITLQKILLLGKTVFSVRQKGVPPLLLPASVLQLPRCLVRICNLTSHHLTLFELDSFKKCNCSRNNLLQVQFASQMWATRPHLGSIFKKLLHRKTFWLPVARCLQLSFQIIQFPLRFQSTQSNVPLGRCHSKRLYPANIIIENSCFRVNRNI